MSDQQKQLKGKLPYFNRVDVKACCEGVARVRHKAIDVIGKYPENMEWPDIPINHFIDATFRHLMEVMNLGVNAVDPETGELHIDAIQWNLMVIQMKREGRERCIQDSSSVENVVEKCGAGEHKPLTLESMNSLTIMETADEPHQLSTEPAVIKGKNVAVMNPGLLMNFILSKMPLILADFSDWIEGKDSDVCITPK